MSEVESWRCSLALNLNFVPSPLLDKDPPASSPSRASSHPKSQASQSPGARLGISRHPIRCRGTDWSVGWTSRRQRSPTRRRTPTDCAAMRSLRRVRSTETCHGAVRVLLQEPPSPRLPFILFPCCAWNRVFSLGVQKDAFPLAH